MWSDYREMIRAGMAAGLTKKKLQQGNKDMSIKERMEVGQVWKDTLDSCRYITGMGRESFFSTCDNGPENTILYSQAEHWTLTHLADGTPVEEKEKPDEIIKVDVEWYDGELDTEMRVDMADGHKDYICWEDEDGNLYGHFRSKSLGAERTVLNKEAWDSGEWVEVKPVKLWFRGGGE